MFKSRHWANIYFLVFWTWFNITGPHEHLNCLKIYLCHSQDFSHCVYEAYNNCTFNDIEADLLTISDRNLLSYKTAHYFFTVLFYFILFLYYIIFIIFKSTGSKAIRLRFDKFSIKQIFFELSRFFAFITYHNFILWNLIMSKFLKLFMSVPSILMDVTIT